MVKNYNVPQPNSFVWDRSKRDFFHNENCKAIVLTRNILNYQIFSLISLKKITCSLFLTFDFLSLRPPRNRMSTLDCQKRSFKLFFLP